LDGTCYQCMINRSDTSARIFRFARHLFHHLTRHPSEPPRWNRIPRETIRLVRSILLSRGCAGAVIVADDVSLPGRPTSVAFSACARPPCFSAVHVSATARWESASCPAATRANSVPWHAGNLLVGVPDMNTTFTEGLDSRILSTICGPETFGINTSVNTKTTSFWFLRNTDSPDSPSNASIVRKPHRRSNVRLRLRTDEYGMWAVQLHA